MELTDAEFSLAYDGVDFNVPFGPGVNLSGQEWRPPGRPPTFVVVFVHGLGAFITFKRDLFSVVTREGGAVFACDHYGHGRSPGARTSCTVEEIVEETMKVIEFAHSIYPTLPITLYGHSLGGLCAISTVFRHHATLKHARLRSVIIECPWIFQSQLRPIKSYQRIGLQILNLVRPTYPVDRGVNSITDDLDPRWATLIKGIQGTDAYPQTVTPRLLISVQTAQKFVQENAGLWPAELPLLVLQGEKDSAVDAKGNERWARQVVEAQSESRVVYRAWPEGAHFLLKGAARGEVLRQFFAFIRQ